MSDAKEHEWVVVNASYAGDPAELDYYYADPRIPSQLAFRVHKDRLCIAANLQNDAVHNPKPGSPHGRLTQGFELLEYALKRFCQHDDDHVTVDQVDKTVMKVADFDDYTLMTAPMSPGLSLKEVVSALEQKAKVSISKADVERLNKELSEQAPALAR